MEGVYINCGSDVFIPEFIVKKFDRFDKPSGLWASPEDSDWGWREWCEAEDFRSEEQLAMNFRFKLKDGARVLQVYSLKDIEPYLAWHDLLERHKLNLDLIHSEFDAMEVHIDKNWNEFHNSDLF